MSKPRGKPTQGARFLFKPAATWLKLEGLNDMPAPEASTEDIDVTDFDSEVKESISGSKDFGEVTLAGQYLSATDAPNQAMLEALAGKDGFPIRFCLPDDFTKTKYTVKECIGRVKKFKGGDSKVFDKQTFSVTIKINSEPVRYDDVPVADLTKESLEPAGP